MNYDEFTALDVDRRIDWIDSFDLKECTAVGTNHAVKSLFRSIYDGDSNAYIRKRAIECISELTLFNIIRYGFTKDFLLEEILDNEDVFVEVARLKYLFLLYGDDPEVYSKFVEASQSEFPEIASEAYVRLGLLHFLYKTGGRTDSSILKELEASRSFLHKATAMVENRIDADLFIRVCNYLIALLGGDPLGAENDYYEVVAIFRRRTIWGWLPGTELVEYSILNALARLRTIAIKSVGQNSWTDYRAEFLVLSKCMNDLLINESLEPRFAKTQTAFHENITLPIVSEYYVNNLSACVLKIEALIANTPSEEEEFKSFLIGLNEQLRASKEKKSEGPGLSLVARLSNAFRMLDLSRIEVDVSVMSAEGRSEDQVMAALAMRYASELNLNRIDFATGYPASDSVFKDLQYRVRALLPDYPQGDFQVAMSVLADLLQYQYQSLVLGKKLFAPLYDSTVKTEQPFQDHLYGRLISTPRATYYHYEDTAVVGGSRVDIVYREPPYVFPVEVKKTETKPTWEMIQSDYVAQAQTYAHPYSQLGFLVVFDITSKKENSPVNNFRDLSTILHLKPFYEIEGKHPDYIITLIVPGNKISPSEYTKYN